MMCSVMELRYKEVVNINDGSCMGCVSDLEVDTTCARVRALIIYGRPRLLGLLGRKEDTVIPWEQIECIGEDAVLVKYCYPPGHKFQRKNSALNWLFG